MKTYIFIVCLVGVTSVPYPNSPSGLGAYRITSASNNFSQRLYQQIAVRPENQFYSPASIHQALAMTSVGARGDTETEIRTALGLNDFQGGNAPHQAYRDVIQQLNDAREVVIRSANAIFVNKDRTVESAFINDVRNFYLAEASTFDPNDPAGPETAINDYVENKTNGYIKDIIPPGSIDYMTLAVIVNAMYLNGSWERPFHEGLTKKAPFFTEQGTIQVDTMFDERTMNIKRNFYGADVGEMKIVGGRFSLFFLLPHTVDGLAAQESSLTIPGRIEELFEGLAPVRVKLSIPKGRISSSYTLQEPLKALGIVKAFDQIQANFTGIDREGGIYISQVFHQAVIEVNESGIIAAAATALLIETVSALPSPTETFIVDHPFIFFVRDNQLKYNVFQGKYITG